MKRILQKVALLTLALGCAAAAMAQVPVKGKVVDARTNEALTGAVVINAKTNRVAVAAADGAFTLSLPSGVSELTVTFLGYLEKKVEINVTGQSFNAGVIAMEADAYGMDAVVISAGIVINDRMTPVAISNVSLEQIEMKLSNQELPEVLKSTPSVYATKDNGGYGDGRINLRGFDSNNVGVLINGVPVNDMESGKVYWSNWSGLSDVTTFMQVQRGLGASKLGLSSVGGTINIVTRSTDAVQGGSVYYGVGNDGLQKETFSLSTGLMDNGWAITLAGGHATADGYVRGTNYEAWNYFINVSKQLGAGHRLSLTALGAPQWHNQRATRYLIEDFHKSPLGARLNQSYGYVNGEIMATGYGYNVYHKPQISLVHYWTINEKSSLSTSVYASIAQGGGRRLRGKTYATATVLPNGETMAAGTNTAHWLVFNNLTGKKYEGETKLNEYGLLDYDWVYYQNRNSVNGSYAAFSNAVNSHDWYGILSTYNNQLTDEIKLTAGFDGRYYRGYHQERLTDLLGGEYFVDGTTLAGLGRNGREALHVGDVVGYDEIGEVLWTSVFAQGEYVKDNFSAFLSGSFSANNYRWHNYGDLPKPDYKQVSDWLTFTPFSVKAGANYQFLENHNVFANGGYFTRAPFFNNSFVNYSTVPNKDAKNERVWTGEIGYGFANNFLTVNLNGYYTMWLDRAYIRSINNEAWNLSGVNARHMGVELEAIYRPASNFNVKGMFSLGDWIWLNDVNGTVYDPATNQQIGTPQTLYIAGVHVGNSAQMTAALGANYTPFKGFRLGADFNWFGKNFANYEPKDRTAATYKGDSWQMPDYWTVDLSMSYKFKVGNINGTLYSNINNLFNAEYISDATDGSTHNALSALVFYGFGRTWTFGLKFNF